VDANEVVYVEWKEYAEDHQIKAFTAVLKEKVEIDMPIEIAT